MLAGLWLVYASFGLVLGAIPPLIGSVSGDLNLSRSAMGSVLECLTVLEGGAKLSSVMDAPSLWAQTS